MDRTHLVRLKRIGSIVALGVCLQAPAFAQQPPAQAAQPNSAPTAEVNPEAVQRFKTGIQMFDDGAYDGALVEFRRAYALAPNYRIFYNMGVCHQRLGDHAGAHRAFTQYLQGGGTAIPAERRREVEESLAKAAARTARIRVRTNRDGATVLLDDVPVGTTPLQDVLIVNVGRHHIAVVMEGRVLARRYMEAATLEELDVNLDLESAQMAPDAPRTMAALPATNNGYRATLPAPRSSRLPMWIGIAATGAFAIGAGVTGTLAVGANADHTAELERFPGNPSAIEDARGRTRKLAIATDVLSAAALVAGGVSVYLFFRHSPETPKKVDVSVSLNGASLTKAF